MARKKDKRKPASLSEVLGVNDILHNEFLNFIIGFLLLALAIYMILSFISYFATGAADQSLIEAPRAGEIMNNDREFQNSCGSIGAYVAHFFINRCFGLAAFMIPVFLVMAALKLIRAYQINLSKWFIGSMLLMISIVDFSSLNFVFKLTKCSYTKSCQRNTRSHLYILSHLPVIGNCFKTKFTVIFATFLIPFNLTEMRFRCEKKSFHPLLRLRQIGREYPPAHCEKCSTVLCIL